VTAFYTQVKHRVSRTLHAVALASRWHMSTLRIRHCIQRSHEITREHLAVSCKLVMLEISVQFYDIAREISPGLSLCSVLRAAWPSIQRDATTHGLHVDDGQYRTWR
jgi:hypothetical protein